MTAKNAAAHSLSAFVMRNPK